MFTSHNIALKDFWQTIMGLAAAHRHLSLLDKSPISD